jgi:CubicO group peptidase (beta-lactamase class C family)
MAHSFDLRTTMGAALLWAACALPALAAVDQVQLQKALTLGQNKGTGSIDVYVGGTLAGSAGPRTKVYDLKSSTKSFGGVLLCLALDDGKVALSDFGAKYVANFGQPSTAAAQKVTVKQLATHTAGFDKAGGFIPILYTPGSAFAYSDGGANWLADVLTSAYQQDMAVLFRNRIGSKLGISIGWRANAYRPQTLDGVPRREFGSGISTSVDVMAKVGLLLLNGGSWNGSRIVSSGCVQSLGVPASGLAGLPVKTSFTPGASKHYGLLWWNNGDGAIANVPQDAFWSWGLNDSFILVVPSKGLVVSRAGTHWQTGWKADYRVLAPFFQAVVAAIG